MRPRAAIGLSAQTPGCLPPYLALLLSDRRTYPAFCTHAGPFSQARGRRSVPEELRNPSRPFIHKPSQRADCQAGCGFNADARVRSFAAGGLCQVSLGRHTHGDARAAAEHGAVARCERAKITICVLVGKGV